MIYTHIRNQHTSWGAARLYHKEFALEAIPAADFSNSSDSSASASTLGRFGRCGACESSDEVRSDFISSGIRALSFFSFSLLGERRKASQSKPAATLTLRLSTKLFNPPRRPCMLSLKSAFFKMVLRRPSPSLPSMRMQGCLYMGSPSVIVVRFMYLSILGMGRLLNDCGWITSECVPALGSTGATAA